MKMEIGMNMEMGIEMGMWMKFTYVCSNDVTTAHQVMELHKTK